MNLPLQSLDPARAASRRDASAPGTAGVWRTRTALLAGLLLAGCAATPTDDTAQQTEPAAQPAIAAAEAAPAPKPEYADLDGDTLYRLVVAELAVRRGQLEVAVKNYLETALDHADPGLAERATRISVFAQDRAASLKASELWAELDPGSAEAGQVYGALLLRAGRLDESAAELRRVVERDTEPDRAYGRLADLLSREKDRRAAMQVMRRVAAFDGDALAARFALAAMASRIGDMTEARKLLQELAEEHPGEERVTEYLSRVLQSQGKTPEATALLEQFLASNPGARNARMSYGRLLVGQQRYDEARTEFSRLVEADAQDSEARYALAIVLMQGEQYAAAKVHFEALQEQGQRRNAASYYLGQIAERDGDLDVAVDAYARVRGGEFFVGARIRAARLLAERGELANARASLQGLRRQYRSEAVRLYRAEADILVMADDLRGAIAVYDEALSTRPQNSDLLYSRAMVSARADDVAALERDLRDILSREPNNADALNALGYTLTDKTNRHQEALDLIERALQLKPDDHYVIDSMGWVLFRLGRYDESVEFLRRAWDIRQDPEVAAHLGEVLWTMGRQDEARNVWDKALADSPDDEKLNSVIERLTQ
ncbi:MAG: tetratricopeptide repeat protein [Pseudomonadota bacterium]